MKELLVAGVLLTALAIASRADAADLSLPLPVKAATTPSGDDWNGFYAGGRAGYAWGTSNWTASTPGVPNVSGSLDLFQPFDAFKDTGSFSQGLQAGYNYMLPNRIAAGAEADVTFPGFPNNAGISIGGISNLASPTLGAETFSETVLTSGTVRAVGYTYESYKIIMPAGARKPVIVPYLEHVPPDVTAGIFWSKNRRPDRWRDTWHSRPRWASI
jgi:high affinity Mn2+ porin